MRVVFMGTPDFAVASLDALVADGIEVVAVITAPDKATGRGLKITESPVKKYAVANNIPVLQPEKLKNAEFLATLASYNADLQVVVAFRMLPEVVWNMPSKGTINLHGSLLPQYRGAAPINWAIINGESETGVTTFFIEKEIDTGNTIFAEKIAIANDENAGSLHDRMMTVGANLLVKTIHAISENNYPSVPQDFSAELKAAPKIFKETCKIDWSQSTEDIYNLIRGLSPYPAAFTLLNGKVMKIYECQKVESVQDLKAFDYDGVKVFTDQKQHLIYQTSDGYLAINVMQIEGKKRMVVEDFLRGFREF